jgi:hypothetical protein
VAAVRASPVPELTSVTFAPDITLPVGSLNVPLIVPLVACAWPYAVAKQSTTMVAAIRHAFKTSGGVNLLFVKWKLDEHLRTIACFMAIVIARYFFSVLNRRLQPGSECSIRQTLAGVADNSRSDAIESNREADPVNCYTYLSSFCARSFSVLCGHFHVPARNFMRFETRLSNPYP